MLTLSFIFGAEILFILYSASYYRIKSDGVLRDDSNIKSDGVSKDDSNGYIQKFDRKCTPFYSRQDVATCLQGNSFIFF